MSTTVTIDGAGSAALPATNAVASSRLRSRWWIEALTIAWLAWVYDAITNLAPLRVHAALAHAGGVLDLERTLHIAPERALDGWLASHHTLGLVVADYYDNAHFLVTLSLLAWLWWRRPDIYRPLRNSLVLVNLVAFAVFWRYPVAPPRMLPGFTDVVATTHAIGSWHTGALASQANQLAAMPSLHIAWAVWCTVVLWRASARVWVRVAAVCYPCVTAAAVLLTGNHFVLDIVAGALAMAFAFAVVALAARGRRERVARALGRAQKTLASRSGRAYPMSQSCYEVPDQVD